MRTSDDEGLLGPVAAVGVLATVLLLGAAGWGWVAGRDRPKPATEPATAEWTKLDTAYINGIYDGIKLAVFFEGVDLGMTGEAALARSAKLCGHYTVERALADVVEHGLARADAVELGISVAIVTKAACTPKDRKRA